MHRDDRGSFGIRTLWKEIARDAIGLGKRSARDHREHLDATMAWIASAQDVGDDPGIARQFHLQYGWRASYPETTGYIIETALDYAKLTGSSQWELRARRMGQWLLEQQLPNGAIYGGDTKVKTRAPAVFNTGMVLHGWLRLLSLGDDADVRSAAHRAADFLVASMDEDGAWRRNLSILTHGSVHTYNTRTAWALAAAGRMLGVPKWSTYAQKNVVWALAQQNDVGWLARNDLTDDSRPLTHTIAYALRGILETSAVCDRHEWVDPVRQTCDALMRKQRDDGSLAGRFFADWSPAVPWTCLTGVAQIAIVWFKLASVTGDPRYRDAAVRATRYVMSTQRLRERNRGIRGGVKGSFPVWGGYITMAYPNWAAKFLAEALMLQCAEDPP